MDKAEQIFDQQGAKTLEPKDKFRLLTLRAEYHLQKNSLKPNRFTGKPFPWPKTKT